jgi:hypothetical protein
LNKCAELDQMNKGKIVRKRRTCNQKITEFLEARDCGLFRDCSLLFGWSIGERQVEKRWRRSGKV